MDNSFTETERIKNKAFSKRVGNDLLERDNNGHVTKLFGYFDKGQILARKVHGLKLERILKLKKYAQKHQSTFYDIYVKK